DAGADAVPVVRASIVQRDLEPRPLRRVVAPEHRRELERMRDDVEIAVEVEIHVDGGAGRNVILQAERPGLVLERLSLLVPIEGRRRAAGPQPPTLYDVEILPGIVVQVRAPGV